jgi:hypothetical protein
MKATPCTSNIVRRVLAGAKMQSLEQGKIGKQLQLTVVKPQLLSPPIAKFAPAISLVLASNKGPVKYFKGGINNHAKVAMMQPIADRPRRH